MIMGACRILRAYLPASPAGRRLAARARRGVAALEFALMAPALVLLMGGMYDLARGWMTSLRLARTAYSVAQIASLIAVQSGNTSTLSYNDAWRAATAAYAAMPQMLAPGAQYSVTLTEVVFLTGPKCANGSYCIAEVVWSANFLGSGQRRPCVKLTAVPDSNPPNLATLPADAFSVAPIFLVDATYTYQSLFLKTLLGNFPMHTVQFFPARVGDQANAADQIVSYNNPLDPAAQCPPYPP